MRPLSKNEIKKDINLIETRDDSDSDCSVSSSEAIPSYYPVKPRNFARLPKKEEAILDAQSIEPSNIDIGGGMSMGDALEFMKAVETARNDVFEAEKEREILEIRYQAIREMCLTRCESFVALKKEERNYIRAAQGSCRNRCEYYDSLSRKNSMLYDMITALRTRKEELNYFADTRTSLEKIAGKECQINKKDVTAAENKFFLFKNQRVRTPMGNGVIASLDPQNKKAIVELPFGYLCCTFLYLESCVSKCGGPLDLSVDSINGLREKWEKCFLAAGHVGPSQQRIGDILDLLKAAKSSSTHLSKSKRSISNSSSKSTAEENMNEVSRMGASVCVREAGNQGIGMELNKKIPLLYCPPGLAPYMTVNYAGQYETLGKQANSDPSDDKQKAGDLHQFHPDYHPEHCLAAFEHSEPIRFFNVPDKVDNVSATPRSSAHDETSKYCLEEYYEEIDALKSALRPVLQQINEYRGRKRLLASQVEKLKISSAQISQQISNLRLGAFTRRVLTAQNASNLKILGPTEAVTLSQSSINSTESVVVENTKTNEVSEGMEYETASNSNNAEPQAPTTRRKSTRAAAALVSTSNSSTNNARTNKRKKDESVTEEEAVADTKSSTTTSSNTTSLKRNSKRLRK